MAILFVCLRSIRLRDESEKTPYLLRAATVQGVKSIFTADIEYIVLHYEAVCLFTFVGFYTLYILLFARKLEDRRVAIIGIRGSIECIIVQPADSFALPFSRIVSLEWLRLTLNRIIDTLAFLTFPIENPAIGGDDVIVILNQDIFAIRRNICRSDEMETFIRL